MKVLVIGPSWVGDMVMAQSLFITLRQQHPDAEIHVLAPAWCLPLLAMMPEVERGLEMHIGHGELGIGKRRAIARTLRQEKFDQAIVLPNSFKSALIPWFAGIPKRTGWRGEARSWLLNDCRTLDKQRFPLMVERFVALAFPAGEPLTQALPRPRLALTTEAVTRATGGLELEQHSPVLVLCPGAEFGEAKKWPASGYADVALDWLEQGGQVWILGSANDHQDAETIRQRIPQSLQAGCHNLAGRTSLEDAIALMSCAALVVSNDSGLMHVAAALARPLVVIYGSTSPAFTPPLADRVRIVSLELACSPCFKRTCPLGHGDCLKTLSSAQVRQAMAELAPT